MAGPGDEVAHSGPPGFGDVVDVQVLDESLPVAVRVARVPAEGSARAMAVVIAGDEQVAQVAETVAGGVASWEDAVAGPVRMTVEEPLAHWTLSLDAGDVRVALDLRALTAPADLDEPATAAIGRAAGLRRYVQLCEVHGTAVIRGEERRIDGVALRSHRWGPLGEAGRARFLTAVLEDGTLLAVAAVQQGGDAHGDEMIGGFTTAPATSDEAPALPFETVRLSTVFGANGLPEKVGAELFRPGEELPSRLGGVALGGVAGDVDGGRTSLTVFRLRLDGAPALGSYEIEAAA